MPLVTSEKMLLKAREGCWALGAFNAENMEMIQAIIKAAEELNAPVIIQTTPGTLKYGSLDLYLANVSALAKNSPVPVAIHLDHGDTFALAAQALRKGYTSIMIDGSKYPLDENISLTESVVKFCKPCNVPVEGELGKVGGKEDGMSSDGAGYTDPAEAALFVEKTGVSSLAVGVGTAHGVYAKTPVLKVELICVLKNTVSIPLVLHGASGLSDDVVKDCIRRGICKVNFATELRIAYTEAVKDWLSKNPSTIDPKKFGNAAREAVSKKVMERMKICGCDGKAPLVL
ncbi:MAG: class II fructose-bisphosphate aldolase [Treponema sp.]|jgi:tagatose 1,6-diphosphate aldolase GatY/KbaY|nr:class II fructose-bisphosphate aldolase [Treponema sp.]